ncbi:MAG: Fic family protein [Flavobacteriaceae bacterium]|nr:Fic family protein [Flavobacteriaceae bacterium]
MKEREFISLCSEYFERTQYDQDYQDFNRIAITYHSCRLEGLPYSQIDTMMILNHAIYPDREVSRHYITRVEDHHQALLTVLQNAEEKKPLTKDLIQDVSGQILKNESDVVRAIGGTFDPRIGEFRRCDVTYGVEPRRSGYDYNTVVGHTLELMEEINERNQQLDGDIWKINELAFETQMRLVTIHPFVNGNSRLSRLLMNYIQHYHQSPLGIVLLKDKPKYWEALYRSQETRDPSYFQRFMMDQTFRFLKARVRQCRPQKEIVFKTSSKRIVTPKTDTSLSR